VSQKSNALITDRVIIIIIMKEFIVRLLQCGHEHRCIKLSITLKTVVSEITDKHSRMLYIQKSHHAGGAGAARE